jgi:hypothetical protein
LSDRVDDFGSLGLAFKAPWLPLRFFFFLKQLSGIAGVIQGADPQFGGHVYGTIGLLLNLPHKSKNERRQ